MNKTLSDSYTNESALFSASKANYFKKQHIYLPEVNELVQNGHGVLSRLVAGFK